MYDTAAIPDNPTVGASQRSTAVVLSIKDLHKSYRSGVEVLKGINLEAHEGDFVALLGANGAGKTTTIGILTGLIRKTSGRVHMFDYDIDRQFNQARALIGVVPQEHNFSLFEKCRDIVINQGGYYGLPRRQAERNADECLAALKLSERAQHMSRTLSGGMRRKLMIARALVHKPKLLFLDEPTAGLDVEFRRELWDFLTDLNKQGITIILTTHYLEEAERLCNRVAIIDHGIIVENTSLQNLLSQLDQQTYLLDLSEAPPADWRIAGYDIRQTDTSTIQIEMTKSHNLNELFAELTRRGIRVISIRNQTNRLEELFMRRIYRNNKAADASPLTP